MESELFNDTLTNETELICPSYGAAEGEFLEKFAFWIEGVTLCMIGFPGIFGNALSAYILAGKSMRNSFNLLLIALATIDNTYLFISVVESCRRRFHLETDLHLLLFPYFLYPLHSMAMTGSILMTVAIALERYNAVHWPISYSQTMNDSRALKIRVLKYLIPVTVICIVFNITKFFEITVVYVPIAKNTTSELNNATNYSNFSSIISEGGSFPEEEVFPLENVSFVSPKAEEPTEYRITLNITEFRTDPMYSINFNWFRFIAIGVIPFLLLVYFNTQIYLDIRKQRRRKRAAKAKKFATEQPTVPEVTVQEANTGAGRWKKLQRLLPHKKTQMSEEVVQMVDCTQIDNKQPRRALVRTKLELEKVEDESGNRLLQPPNSREQLISVEIAKNGGEIKNSTGGSPCSSRGSCGKSCTKCPESCPQCKNLEAISSTSTAPAADDIKVATEVKPTKTEASTMVKVRNGNIEKNSVKKPLPKKDKDRDSKETSLAFIMMVYVLVFLICHFPRLFLNLIELTTIRNAMACQEAGRQTFSFWSLIGVYINHLLLVINSAINILIYCCLSSKFREEGIQVMRGMIHHLSCGRFFARNPMNPSLGYSRRTVINKEF